MRTAWLLVFLTLLLLAAAARAQSIELAPVMVHLAPGQRTAVLTLANRGAAPLQIQVRPFLWRELPGEEQLLPTDELAVSPPLTEVPPGQAQTIRLVLRRPPGATESAYRLLIDQLPSAPASGSIRIALRFSVPVFAPPAEALPLRLAARVLLGRGGPELVVENAGPSHVRVLSGTLNAGGAAALPIRTLANPYILPGAERRWPISGGLHFTRDAAASLTLQTDGGPIGLTAPFAAAP